MCGGEVGDGEQKRRGIVFDLVSFHVMFFFGFSLGFMYFLVLVERIVV